MTLPIQRPLQTLKKDVEITGIGLHSGAPVRVRLRPYVNVGVLFVRVDLPSQPHISAALRCITHTTHATTLQENGASVSTVEHLMAALWAAGITGCRVELDGPEVPILDGSALPWCRLLQEAGVEAVGEVPASRPVYTLREPVWVSDGVAHVLGLPHHEFRLTVAVDYDLAYNSRQVADLVVTADSFTQELAPARTFTLEEWLAPLRQQGLIQGGTLDNAIVLGVDGPSSPWRLEGELARHKALDAVGDLALLLAEEGGFLNAHLTAVRAGHPLHQRWMQQCLEQNALLKIE